MPKNLSVALGPGQRKLAGSTHPVPDWGVLPNDCLSALGACRDHSDWRADELLNPIHVGLCCWRQLIELCDAGSLGLPASHRLVYRCAFTEQRSAVRHLRQQLVLVLVANADLDVAELVQYVQLRQRYRIQAVEHHRVSYYCSVEPPGAARPPGRSTVFVAALLEVSPGLVQQLRRKRTAADSRAVRLGDSQRTGYRARRQTQSCCCPSSGCI